MPIYDISGLPKHPREERSSYSGENVDPRSAANFSKEKTSFVSSFLSRLFFTALLLLDLAWGVYAAFFFVLGFLGGVLTLGKVPYFWKLRAKGWLSVKRSLACGLSLLAAIFSPAFGIMIACTYFLMYDKSGIEEVIPASLQDQFRDFFK